MTKTNRLQAIQGWLQQEDKELLYTPDGQGVGLRRFPYYILEGQTPVPEADCLTWARWFETADRKVAHTEVKPGIEVSTVFLGINHSWGEGPPLLFETMVFEDSHAWDWQERYTTWAEAEHGHQAMCDRIRAGRTREAIDE